MASDTKIWDQLVKKIGEAANRHVKVGVLASKGGLADHDGITMVELAAIHEFGSPAANIPERSFIRKTFILRRKELAEMTRKLAKQIITKDMPVDKALDILGAWGAAQVKKTVTTGDEIRPPLKKATIDRKGSSRPLIDTDRLINSVQWEVEQDKGSK